MAISALTWTPAPLESVPQVGSASGWSELAAAPHLLFRNTRLGDDYGRLAIAPLGDPGRARVASALRCERISAVGQRGICLQANRGVFTTYRAVMFDDLLTPRHDFLLDGAPSRTRLSRDGRLGAITVFVTGHAYTSSFSTQTLLVDMETGDRIGELETFNAWRDGERFRAQDFNYWGVTFASDANVFYASLGTAGKTYLIRGDVSLRRLTVLREDVECPSISPDDRRVAYKKRVGDNPATWRLHVLDLETMAESMVTAETRSVDDQVEWLDPDHLLYAIPRPTSAAADVWVAPVNGASAARILIEEAESPIVLR